MVSYQRVEDEEMVLYEAPSASIPQEGGSTTDTQDHEQSTANDPLLSSFDNDDASSTEGGKPSDERLRSHDVEDITRNIEEAATHAPLASSSGTSSQQESQQAASSSNAASSSTSSSSNALSINAISSNFNILDRIFRKKHTGTIFGQGSENDGVFNNMSAKPDAQPQVDSDKPPTYDEAAADATPPYWENSILSPGFNDEVFVDGLPVGNIINFIWNLLVSSSFQFVGFLLTYILHTSHAAKQGSRAGLGITFISYAYYMLPSQHRISVNDDSLASSKIMPSDANNYDISAGNAVQGSTDDFESSLSSGVGVVSEEQSTAKLLIVGIAVAAFGGFLFIKAFVDYHRARKMEDIILAPPVNFSPQQEETV